MITVYLDDKAVDEALKAGVRLNLYRFACRAWGSHGDLLDQIRSQDAAFLGRGQDAKRSMAARMVEDMTNPSEGVKVGEGKQALGADQQMIVEAAVKRAYDGLVADLSSKATEIAAAELRALKEKPRTL